MLTSARTAVGRTGARNRPANGQRGASIEAPSSQDGRLRSIRGARAALKLIGMAVLVAGFAAFGLIAASRAARDHSPHPGFGAPLASAPAAATGDGNPWQI
ncbi:hypothetical protein Msil_0346 [Methylocella silvestris BL2]|uniref:Uncharacterized protein n=1 Tax=Methylocella silvestris (strain DSM 15510 / CIP 108128 / LMG 27833 / NCIMB 13906 / BL2) TaxID=395965 RepID=B8EQQ4_METSB|nr:hypothetical protein Msil_0346 [Methylocella silvestris BL2]